MEFGGGCVEDDGGVMRFFGYEWKVGFVIGLVEFWNVMWCWSFMEVWIIWMILVRSGYEEFE